MYDIEIQLNPNVRYLNVLADRVTLLLNGVEFNLSGPNIQKIFAPIIGYLYKPMKLKDILELFEVESDAFFYDFNKTILLLLKKEILIKHKPRRLSNTVNQINRIILLDFTGKKIGERFKTMLVNQNLKCNIDVILVDNIDEKTIDNIVSGIFDNENKIIIPLYWFFSELIMHQLCKSYKNTILPAVFNYNYFSIGPQIVSEESKLNSFFALSSEENRYRYVNHQNNCINETVFLGLLLHEIIEIMSGKLAMNQENRSRTIGEIITFNNNSFELKIRSYYRINKEESEKIE